MKKFGIENPAMKLTPISDEEGKRLVKEAEEQDFDLAKKLLPTKYKNGSNGVEKREKDHHADILDLATSSDAEEVEIDSDQSGQ